MLAAIVIEWREMLEVHTAVVYGIATTKWRPQLCCRSIRNVQQTLELGLHLWASQHTFTPDECQWKHWGRSFLLSLLYGHSCANIWWRARLMKGAVLVPGTMLGETPGGVPLGLQQVLPPLSPNAVFQFFGGWRQKRKVHYLTQMFYT